MADIFTPEKRSEIMSKIRSKETKLEQKVRREIWRYGVRYVKNSSNLFGKPDIAIPWHRAVIFIDSCYWHACSKHGKKTEGMQNQEYWEEKFRRNKRRDRDVNSYYYAEKWHVLRIWEHELKEDFNGTIRKIVKFAEAAREAHQKIVSERKRQSLIKKLNKVREADGEDPVPLHPSSTQIGQIMIDQRWRR